MLNGSSSSRAPPTASSRATPQSTPTKKPPVVLKVGMIGDSQIGKTSLMIKYVEGVHDEDYIQTLGVNFMVREKKRSNSVGKNNSDSKE
jgi:GTP-binding protein of the ras superfamily involved in termination of M-phase